MKSATVSDTITIQISNGIFDIHLNKGISFALLIGNINAAIATNVAIIITATPPTSSYPYASAFLIPHDIESLNTKLLGTA